MYSIHSKISDFNNMSLKLGRLSLIISFLSTLSTVATTQVSDKNPGIFYEVTKPGLKDTSWLFGTYHLINDSYLKDKSNVQKALNSSQAVVVEVTMENADMEMVQSMGMLKDKTLTDMLGQSFADSLNTELKNTVGIGVAEMNQAKPINVLITLSMVYLMKNNPSIHHYQGMPLDAFFASSAKSSGKEVISLESIEEQMNILFNKMSEEEQVRQLELFLRNKESMIQMGDDLLKSWFDNDMNKIYAIYEKMDKITGNTDFLTKDRNDKWMKTIPKLIESKSHFIAVGALHLAGKDGLVNQLLNDGYTVKPIKL